MDFSTIEFIFPVVIFSALLIVLLVFYIKKLLQYTEIQDKYKGIVNIEEEVNKRKFDLSNLNKEFDELDDKYQNKNAELNAEYKTKREIYEKLLKEISVIEENLDFTEYGLYKPHYDFDTSEKYKQNLAAVREKQKQMVKEKDAVFCSIEWQVGGSKTEGRKMTNQYIKLMLRAFNNECDAAVLKVKWNSINQMEERIKKAFDVINKMGSIHHIEIRQDYLILKIMELRLAHEYQEKLHDEKEEQRQIREQMREEEKAQREIEQAKKEAEEEERRYQNTLEKAKRDLDKATGEEINKLNEQILTLQKQIQEANEKKEKAISRAQLTKSGHVYIISNIGSFGENIYKIGLTRRLEPKDRVKELGDASVPFEFDIHAMVYSENAPDLETKLHRTFEEKRLNLVNNRKEFFSVSLDDIEKAVKNNHNEIEFTKIAQAKEYRESIAMRNEIKNNKSIEEAVEEKFPISL